MTDEVLPDSPRGEESVHFQSVENLTFKAVAICLAFILVSLWLLLSGWGNGLFEVSLGILGLAFFGSVTILHLINLAKGQRLGGLLVNGDGIVDRTSYSPVGRVFWSEIKAIYPVRKSFFPGFAKDLPVIGLDVTDSYLQRTSAKVRRSIWWTRHIFRAPDIQISAKTLNASRETILRVLEDGLRQYELRSISEAKELKSGE
jgi:hypothetical protein